MPVALLLFANGYRERKANPIKAVSIACNAARRLRCGDWNYSQEAERIKHMTLNYFQRAVAPAVAMLILASFAHAQSGATRPRRVNTAPTESRTESNPTTVSSDSAPASTRTAPASRSTTNADTSHAFSLLKQKQYEAAAKEAKQIAATNPNDSEAWKITGFAEFNLKQYAEAANDLQKALDLQRAANQEDPNTVDALAQVYVLTDKFDRALPLLVSATSRKGATPDASMLYYRGLAEYKTGKAADAERSFNAAVRANPKDAASLYYLGQIAYGKSNLDTAIAFFNRATIADPRLAPAWALLTSAYLRRASAATVAAKADADYQSAIRAGEGLTRLRTDAEANTLLGQALISAKQYARAATVLERAAAGDDAKPVTLYLLGVAQSRANNFPGAIAALERAAAKSPDDVNVYRELGYAYESSKQYAKALAAYQKGASLAPNEADLKESVERVRPFAK